MDRPRIRRLSCHIVIHRSLIRQVRPRVWRPGPAARSLPVAQSIEFRCGAPFIVEWTCGRHGIFNGAITHPSKRRKMNKFRISQHASVDRSVARVRSNIASVISKSSIFGPRRVGEPTKRSRGFRKNRSWHAWQDIDAIRRVGGGDTKPLAPSSRLLPYGPNIYSTRTGQRRVRCGI